MKFHLTYDGITAACGVTTNTNSSFYDEKGFTLHYAEEYRCKRCAAILKGSMKHQFKVMKTTNKIEFTPYLAAAYAEGEGATKDEQLQAWAYLIKTGLCWSLQGWYGRAANALIKSGYISKEGEIL